MRLDGRYFNFISLLLALVFVSLTEANDRMHDSLERYLGLVVAEGTIDQASSTSDNLWFQGVTSTGFLRVPLKHRMENHGFNFGAQFKWSEEVNWLVFGHFSRANLRENQVYQKHCHGGFGLKFNKGNWVNQALGFYGEGNANLFGLVGQTAYLWSWRDIIVSPKIELGWYFSSFHGTATGITCKPGVDLTWHLKEFVDFHGTLVTKFRGYSRRGEMAKFTVIYQMGLDYEISEALQLKLDGSFEHGGGIISSLLLGLSYRL